MRTYNNNVSNAMRRLSLSLSLYIYIYKLFLLLKQATRESQLYDRVHLDSSSYRLAASARRARDRPPRRQPQNEWQYRRGALTTNPGNAAYDDTTSAPERRTWLYYMIRCSARSYERFVANKNVRHRARDITPSRRRTPGHDALLTTHPLKRLSGSA